MRLEIFRVSYFPKNKLFKWTSWSSVLLNSDLSASSGLPQQVSPGQSSVDIPLFQTHQPYHPEPLYLLFLLPGNFLSSYLLHLNHKCMHFRSHFTHHSLHTLSLSP